MWTRSTLGLRKIEGTWKIIHAHNSAPFCMDGQGPVRPGLAALRTPGANREFGFAQAPGRGGLSSTARSVSGWAYVGSVARRRMAMTKLRRGCHEAGTERGADGEAVIVEGHAADGGHSIIDWRWWRHGRRTATDAFGTVLRARRCTRSPCGPKMFSSSSG